MAAIFVAFFALGSLINVSHSGFRTKNTCSIVNSSIFSSVAIEMTTKKAVFHLTFSLQVNNDYGCTHALLEFEMHKVIFYREKHRVRLSWQYGGGRNTHVTDNHARSGAADKTDLQK